MLPVIFRGHEDVGFFSFALTLGPGANPLRVLEGNRRTPQARYACLIVVRDYHRLGVEFKNSGQWHYSHIEPVILADVRAGRAVLVFDLSNEGPAYDATIFGPLYNWIERNELPGGRCIFLSQNRLMTDAATAHVGQRAALMSFRQYDYFVKLIAWQFSRMTTEKSRFDPADYLTRLLEASSKDKLLLCLNATPRLARVLTMAGLLHHQLLPRSLASFPGLHYVKAGASLADVLRYLDGHAGLEYLRSSVQEIGRMCALRVDGFREQGNELVSKIDPSVYERSFFSLVTESDFTEPGIRRVTEKTVKAFCMGHPTVVVGNPGSITIMRELGFEDWSAVFDRTAESIDSPSLRFESIFTEILRQTKRIDSDPAGWIDAVQAVSRRNHHYAISGEFLAHYAAAFDLPLLASLTTLVAE